MSEAEDKFASVILGKQGVSDLELLRMLVEDPNIKSSCRDSFQDMIQRIETGEQRQLTPVQRRYAKEVAVEIGASKGNLFSGMTKAKKAEHLEKASKIKMPWEQAGYAKPLKPPGR